MISNTFDEPEDFKRKISPLTKRQGDIKSRFKTDQNFHSHNPFLKKNDKYKNSSSSSQTTTTYDLSLSDDSDDSAEDDNIHHLASFNRNIEIENRNDWITYMKSSVSNRQFETQSVTNNRIKIRSRNSGIDIKTLNILAQSTPFKNPFEEFSAVLGNRSDDHEFQNKMFSADIRYEIFGRSSLNYVVNGNEYSSVDLDEPYSKSVCNKSFYLQVVTELSSLIFKHRDILFSKYRPASSRQRDLFRSESRISTLGGGDSEDLCFSQTLAPFFNLRTAYSTEDEGSEQSHHSSEISTETSLVADTPASISDTTDQHDVFTDILDLQAQLSGLYAAVNADDTIMVISIMKRLPPQGIIDYRDEFHKSMLHIACERNNIALAKIFLAIGFTLDSKDCSDRTCLHLTDSEEVVIALCEAGASSDILDAEGRTPLHVYILKENKACLSAIMKYGADSEALLPPNQWSGLHIAASLGNAEIIQLLLTQPLAVVDIHRKVSRVME